jgi:hypothetical protein
MNLTEAREQLEKLERGEELVDAEIEKLKEVSRTYAKQRQQVVNDFAREHAEYPVGTRLRHRDGRIGTVTYITSYSFYLPEGNSTMEKIISEIKYMLEYPNVKHSTEMSGEVIKKHMQKHGMRLAATEEKSVKTTHKIVKVVKTATLNNAYTEYMLITNTRQAFTFKARNRDRLETLVSVEAPARLVYKHNKAEWKLTTKNLLTISIDTLVLIEDEAEILGALM